MAFRDDTYTQHQLERWTRPDAHHFVRADWRRHVRSGHENDFPFVLYERKYRPDQRRIPAGNPDGGQWTSDNGFSYFAEPSNLQAQKRESLKPLTRIAASISPERQLECERQYQRDSAICRIVGTRSCWAQAAFRLSQCLIGGYIPDLYHEVYR